jgi:transposase
MVERGRVVVTTVTDATAATLMPHITKRVLPEAVVYTDERKAYNQVGKSATSTAASTTARMSTSWTRPHQRHRGVLVAGEAWHLRRPPRGGPKYLQGYLNEYAWRYDHRNDATPMFRTLLENVRRDPALGGGALS